MNPRNLKNLLLAARTPRHSTGSGSAWTANLRDGSAVHEAGLVARFVQLPLREGPGGALDGQTAVDLCWLPTGYPVWAVVLDEKVAANALRAAEISDEGLALAFLRALTREAGAAWIEAVQGHARDAVRDELRLPRVADRAAAAMASPV